MTPLWSATITLLLNKEIPSSTTSSLIISIAYPLYTEGNTAFPYCAVGNSSSNVAKLLFNESILPCTASNKPVSPEV
jgi:hypothetical protein